MLYSLAYEARRGTERRMFYAQNGEEAQEIVRNYGESKNISLAEIRVKTHPRGFYMGSRFYPAKERKRA